MIKQQLYNKIVHKQYNSYELRYIEYIFLDIILVIVFVFKSFSTRADFRYELINRTHIRDNRLCK